MTWFRGASYSPQGVPDERGPNPANPLSVPALTHTHAHADVFNHMCTHTCAHTQHIYGRMWSADVKITWRIRPARVMGEDSNHFSCKFYTMWFNSLSQELYSPPLLPLVFVPLPVSGVRDLRRGWGGVGRIIMLLQAAARRGEKVGKGEKGWDPGGRRAYSWTGFDRGAGLIAIMIRPISAEG